MAISVGKLGKMFGVSRTTLLYYDSIGLLRPSGRSSAGYRLYEDADVERLRQILIFREIGTSLGDINVLLCADDFDISAHLLKRLKDLNNQIEVVKTQQNIIVKLLKNFKLHEYKENPDKNDWIRLVKTAGIEFDRIMEWHYQFEKNSSEQHYKFLQMLKFTEAEIEALKSKLKTMIENV